uniref:CCHC-type domain-containing protein n=1 Tax=Tanacetum cinerariifolium TaxID=118510 RepID=A0A6L2JJ96_TANCI|nr:hypothetical protein [Tanacetum cinerariifolium]
MSAKRTSWNEFSSSMALAVICLTTGRKFNFSKYIFDSLDRNVDSPLKFYMYPRFIQLMINAQIANLSAHATKYTSPALTQKVFANMRRVGKGFSRVDTPLFDEMLVSHQVHDAVTDDGADNVADDVADDKIAQAIEITKLKKRVRRLEKKRKLKATRLKRSRKVGTAQRVKSSADTVMDDQEDASKQGRIAELDADEDVTLEEVDTEKDAKVQGRFEESQAQVNHLVLKHAQKVLSLQETDKAEPAEVEEVLEVVTAAKLMTEVVTTATTPIIVAPVPKASAPRRKRGVIIQDPKEASTASLSVQSKVKSKDKGKGILVEDPKPLKRQAQIEHDEAYAKELEAKLNANINWMKFASSGPKNFSDDFLLNALKTMFEKPNVEANIWKNQRVQIVSVVQIVSAASIRVNIVSGLLMVLAPTTAEQRLARKNELKARGTFLMALPDKHQLKFNIHKDAKSLMEAIKKRLQKLISQLEILGESLSQEDINLKFLKSLPTKWRTHTLFCRNKTDLEDQSLDDLFNSLKIYEAEVKSSSSTSPTAQNIAFVSSQNTDSTNESVSVVTSVSVASTKVPVFALPNVDNLSDAFIYSFFASQSNSPQLDNDDLKQIDADDLKEMDLKWQMAMLTIRARRFLQRTKRNLGANGTTFIGFDMSKVECYNCHRRGHFTRECRSPRDTRNKDTQKRNVPVETSTSNALVSQCDGVSSYDWSFQADEEPTNYALMAFTPSSSSSFDNEFDVRSYKIGLKSIEARLVVYQQNETVFEEDIKQLKLDVVLRDNALVELKNTFEKAEQERDELKLKLENFLTSSKNLSKLLASQITDKTRLGYDNQVFNSTVFDCDELISSESNVSMPPSPVHNTQVIPTTVLTRSRLVPLTTTKPVTAAVPQTKVQHQRPTKHGVNKAHSPIKRPINLRPSPTHSNFYQKATNVKTNKINDVKGVKGNWHALKDKGVIDSGCLRHITGNISYLFNFEEINEGYVAFGGNPKGGKIIGKDPLSKFNGKADEGFLGGYSVSSIAFRVFNSRTRIVQETLHINFLENQPNVAGSGPTWLFDIDTLTQSMNYQPVIAGNQPNSSAGIQEHFDAGKAGEGNVQQYEPESTVHVSPSSSAKTNKHDDKTEREAKGKITAVEPNSTNSTNTFTAAGPFNNPVSSAFEFSAVGPSNNVDDEEDVGAEADFSNLETNITVSPILTSRVHKDHPVTQIIGDLYLAPQTRSMTRMVKDQDPDYFDKVYKVVKEFYGLHQALRSWYETLANYLLENGFQRGKIDQALFIKKQKGLQVKQKEDGIFISQDKYVAKILRMFGLTDRKSASTPIDTEKPLLKDPDGEDVDVHTHRYLKGKPHLGLWYPKDSPFNLVTYSDSDYVGASLDRKSTTRGCQFLGCRLISWQCKKQIVVATSSTEAEYVAAASCCAHVLWIQSQLMDYRLILNAVSLKLMLFGLTIDVVHLILLGHKTCATLTKKVGNLEQDKIAQAIEITKLKQRVRRLEKKRKLKASGLKRSRKVRTAQRVESSADTVMDDQEDAPKQGGIAELDADEDVTLEEVDTKKDAKVLGRLEESQAHVYYLDLEHAQKVLSIQETDEAEPAEVEEVLKVVTAAKLMTEVVTTATTSIIVAHVPKSSAPRRKRGVIIQDPKEAATTSLKQVKRKENQDNAVIRYQALERKLVTEALASKNITSIPFGLSWRKEIKEEASKQIKRKSESSKQEAAKKQMIDEEVEELKTHLQIVPNDEDDVYTEATPLALKEDLEMLWKIVQERFTSSGPKNFSDDFLLNALKTMFEKPNVEANIWKYQRGRYGLAKVKSWKLLESCGIHIITFKTTKMILMVERGYPQTRFTLEQMLNNVRLEVKEESEVSLELLRFMRRQQQEGYKPE